MAVISRSIPAVPYQGGTLQTVQPYSCAVQLTSTRMVWTYCQTNPNWRFFVIVDTPDGWANGGTPTVTVARMQDQRAYAGLALYMTRLNDNAFMIMDLNNSGSGVGYGAGGYTTEVFEIDSNNQFNRTYYNVGDKATTSVGGVVDNANWYTSQTIAGARYCNHMVFVPVKDNMVYQVSSGYNAGNVQGRLITYDNTKSITASLSATSYVILGTFSANTYATHEVFWRSIPGSSKISIGWHLNTTLGTATSQAWNNPTLTNLAVTTTSNNYNVVGGVISDFSASVASGAAPTITTTGYASNLWVYTSTSQNPISGMATPYDIVHMSETRQARINWMNAYFYATDGVTSQGGSEFSTTQTVAPMIAYPLDANYIMIMDRTGFVASTSTSINLKIIRREDSNFVTVSPNSTSGTGFSVTVPWIDLWRCHQRPRMQANGDLFYWGLDTSGNLTWNIIKNAVASS